MEAHGGITTTGIGTVRTAPDIARVSIGISVIEREAVQARTAAVSAIAAVIASLRSHGVAGADLRTGQLSLAPEHDYKDGRQKRRGHRATNNLLVTLRDIKAAGEIIDAAASACGDAITVHGVAFEIADPSAIQRQALEAAYADARARAESLAKAAGVSLGAPIRIEEHSASVTSPFPVTRIAMMAEAAPTPVLAGEQEVTASIVATWAIA